MPICIVLIPYLVDNVCASSSWDFWKTPEISFSITAVQTLQPVFMQGRIQDFGNGVQSVLIRAIS